jgi:hypothetical protein
MQIRIQFNRFAQAPDDKCREREFLSTLGLMRSHMLTGAGHVNFDESMYYMLPSTTTSCIERKSAYLGKGLNSIFLMFHCLVRRQRILEDSYLPQQTCDAHSGSSSC